MLRCYIYTQFKLTEVSRLFLLRPGNEASVHEKCVEQRVTILYCYRNGIVMAMLRLSPLVIWQRAVDCVLQCLDCTGERQYKVL